MRKLKGQGGQSQDRTGPGAACLLDIQDQPPSCPTVGLLCDSQPTE